MPATAHRSRPTMARGALALCAMALSVLAGCAGASGEARGVAAEHLRCARSQLRFAALGELSVRPRDPIEVAVYEAEGCDGSAEIFCRRDGGVRCAAEPGDLVPADHVAALTRALYVRRIASRARCAPADERVVQESDSLWVFEACDGSIDYHCTATTCAPIGR